MTRLALALTGIASVTGIAVLTLGGGVRAQTMTPTVSWEQAESVSVRLSIQGREFQAESVEADCFVEGPKQKNVAVRSTRKWSISRDKSQSLYFPEDFNRKTLAGEYEWGCTVAGRTVGKGRFVYVSADEARVLRP